MTTPYDDQCYHASEALYHLLGGKAAGLTPVCLTLTPDWQALIGTTRRTHWYLEDAWGGYLDPTADQFEGRWYPPYHTGTRKGFLTKAPSRKAQALIDRAKELI
jgi:hypothetical protein